MILLRREREAALGVRDREAITDRQRTVHVALRPLREFLRRVKDELGLQDAGVAICLVSDAEIARMNEVFRKKKGPTDVLSFPAVERRNPVRLKRGLPAVKPGEFLGDIAISPETARRYAKKYGRKLPGELRILILHGVLHLLGYDHESDRGEMNQIEQRLRRRFELSR